ncbi:hypothetical protein ACFE04_000682 [Oxalis oulophora]
MEEIMKPSRAFLLEAEFIKCCATCQNRAIKRLKKIKGVESVDYNVEQRVVKVSGDVDHELLVEKFAKIKKSIVLRKKAKFVSFPNHKDTIANNPAADRHRVKQENDHDHDFYVTNDKGNKDTIANNPVGGRQRVKQENDHFDFSNDKDAIKHNMENDDVSWYSPIILKRKGFMNFFEFLGLIKEKEVKMMVPNPLTKRNLKQTNTQPLQVPPHPIFPPMDPFGRMMPPQAHYGSYGGGYSMFGQPPMIPPMMRGGPSMPIRPQDERDYNRPRSPPRGNPMIHYGPQDNYHPFIC